MLRESAVPGSAGELVPSVLKAVQMIEGLRARRSPLRVEDFAGMIACSQRTIYRILETLVACEYVIRDPDGSYRLNESRLATADAAARTKKEVSEFGRSLQANDQSAGFERWGVRFRNNGTRINTHSRDTQPAVSQAGGRSTLASSRFVS